MDKINYQNITNKIINDIDGKHIPKLLLHVCCAPCSSYVLEYLSNYFEITILYYNPNISPFSEYEKRLNEIKRLTREMKLKNKVNIINCDYDNEIFNKMSIGLESEKEGGLRCIKCYNLRLEKAAIYAKKNNFDYFTTTLSISPYKSSDKLNEIGKALESKYNIKYLYSDFKKNNGYKRSIELSKIYNLYRQNYCGCIYSKKEEHL